MKGFLEHNGKLIRNLEITFTAGEVDVTIDAVSMHLVRLRDDTKSRQLIQETEILIKLLDGKIESVVNVLKRYGSEGEMQRKIASAVYAFRNVWEYRKYLNHIKIIAQAFKLTEYVIEEINGSQNWYLRGIWEFLDNALQKKVYDKIWLDSAIRGILYM